MKFPSRQTPRFAGKFAPKGERRHASFGAREIGEAVTGKTILHGSEPTFVVLWGAEPNDVLLWSN